MKGILVATFYATALFVAVAAQSETLLLSDINIVNVESGQTLTNMNVYVENGEISEIIDSSSDFPRDGVTTLDYGGKFLMPGLWDMHVHPETREDLELMVINGVLGARSLMGRPEHLQWRAEIALGHRIGPTLKLAGPIVEGRPPEGMEDLITTEGRRLLTTRDEGIREARAQYYAGFDYIKVYNNLPVAAYRGLAEEGAALGIPVLGHVPIQVGLKNALRWGQVGIEHLRGSIQLLTPSEAPVQPGNDLRSRMLSWQYIDEGKVDELVRFTSAFPAYHCPTIVARLFFSPSPVLDDFLARPEAQFIQPRWRDILVDRPGTKWLSNFSEQDFEASEKGFEKMDAYILALHRAGVPILAGTDMGPWGFTLHDELEALVDAGLTIPEALRTATLNAARFSEMDTKMGVVREGFFADLIVLEKNPLEDISNTRSIHSVLLRGRLLDRHNLDLRLDRIKSEIRTPN